MNTRQRSRGFTLVELMVTITIVTVLAALVVMISKRAMRGARAAADVSNLRQCGVALTSYATDIGYYPAGYNWTSKESWADQIVIQQAGEDDATRQLEIFQSPILARNVPSDLDSEAVVHFGANPYIFSDTGPADPRTGIAAPKWRIRPSQLRRPAEQFLLCSVPPQHEDMPYDAGHSIVWGLRNRAGGGFPENELPRSNSALAQTPIGLSPESAEVQQYNDLPDSFRYRNGKGRYLFVDGHIEAFAPAELKQKHLAVSY